MLERVESYSQTVRRWRQLVHTAVNKVSLPKSRWRYPFLACSYPFVGVPDNISSVFAYHVLRLTKKEGEIDIRMR